MVTSVIGERAAVHYWLRILNRSSYRISLCIVVFLSVAGCTRTEYRQTADQQTYQILKEKSQDPRWQMPRMDITPDPMSRFYDVHDLDTPPLPPDDPAASEYMDQVYGMQGSPTWEQLHKIDHVENPNWPKAFGGGVYTGRLPIFRKPA